jgi:hypothetical protein
MPVCIAGMHRSGTSMITRLLNRCGLDLGPEADLLPPAGDNPEGFWEHAGFVRVNEGLLRAFGGGWNVPVLHAPGWVADPAVGPWLVEAGALAAGLTMREPWGWKDPRNSLHLPFWREVFPALTQLICVRNPLEVAQSLHDRDGFRYLDGFRLWKSYHDALLAHAAPDAVVTHYDAYFQDPAAELRRVRDCLRLPLADDAIGEAAATVRSGLRHHRTATEDVVGVCPPAGVAELYRRFCAVAGPVFAAAEPDRSHDRSSYVSAVRQVLTLEAELEATSDELRGLRAYHAAKVAHLERHADQLTALVSWQDAELAAARAKLSWRRHRWADKLAAAAQAVRR